MGRDNMYSKFLEVSKKTGVPVKKVLDVFFLLSTGESIDNTELLQGVGVSKNALNQVKKSLSSFLKPASKNTQLNSEGSSKAKQLFAEGFTSEEGLWGILEGDQFRETVNLLQSIKKIRPSPKREYDQFTATTETTARRASLLSFFGDVKGKKLLFLGDDDFTSIATASLREAEKIVTLDIDERILREIQDLSNSHELDIKTVKYDARKKLPKELVGKYDVVFTDPPYTPEGFNLFVSRAIETLDPTNKAARVYACYGNSDRAKERFLPIYEVLISSGLMARWVFDKFNRYQGAESIGSSSSLFVAEITPKTKPTIKGDYDRPIYTNI